MGHRGQLTGDAAAERFAQVVRGYVLLQQVELERLAPHWIGLLAKHLNDDEGSSPAL